MWVIGGVFGGLWVIGAGPVGVASSGSRQVEIHHTELAHVSHERFSNRDMERVVHVVREGFTAGKRHDDAVGEPFGTVGVAGSALDLLHDRDEVNQASYCSWVLADPFCADAFFEVEPSNVFCRCLPFG